MTIYILWLKLSKFVFDLFIKNSRKLEKTFFIISVTLIYFQVQNHEEISDIINIILLKGRDRKILGDI